MSAPCNISLQCMHQAYRFLFPLCAGEGLFRFFKPCWSCFGEYCFLDGDSASLGPFGTTSIAVARVSVPGGGQYRLRYRLKNGGGLSNSWQARIASIDGSFPTIVLESLTNSYLFDWTARELPFSLPGGTAAVSLTFEARQVRQRPHGDNHHLMLSFAGSVNNVCACQNIQLAVTGNAHWLWTTRP